MASFLSLQKLQTCVNGYIPKPISYDINKSTFIISTNSASQYSLSAQTLSRGIFEYNLNTNHFQLITKYDKDINLVNHGQFINKQNNIIYMFGGRYDTFCWFNLKTKEYGSDIVKLESSCGIYPVSTYIPSPLNEYHFMSSDKHFKFKMKDNKVYEVERFLDISYGKPVYVHLINKLMIFGSDKNNKILFQENDKWKLYQQQMPHKTYSSLGYDVILSFKHLLFLFYFPYSGFSDIYCLDFNKTKWYKSQYTVPDYFGSTCDYNVYALKGDNDSVYIIDFKTGNRITTSLYLLIPIELKREYAKYFHPLVFGFVKEMEHRNIIPTIPYVLKQLIFAYFPLFL